MSESRDMENFDSSDWEFIDHELSNKPRPIFTPPERGVCCSIKFYDGPEGVQYIPESSINKHPDFAVLFNENKYLDCSPVHRSTAHVVMCYLRTGRLPGPHRDESDRAAINRLFKNSVIFREEVQKFTLPDLEEMNIKGITHLLDRMSILDILEITAKERGWRLPETDDMLVRLLSLRICAQKELIPEEAYDVMDEFCKTADDAKWDLLKGIISIMIDLQSLKNKDRAMTLDRCKAA
ncbi:hypothetical protein FLAG1_04503 [Fusarium langsethiae]|uniref:Uncharacterized protein n=1 Tax=Fusarium langsethiae TaxID=179993 RepID=A0A0M9EZ38_FUSLA|nr:hypothetical protein FLAG1_04503 [Fusarium langsethiae]GKU04542.1 unnamed protein product [Fusarium langsethiae]